MRHGHNDPVRVGWRPTLYVEPLLFFNWYVEQVAEPVVAAIFRSRQPFGRIGPDVDQ
jgi:hypothetical protein